MRCFTAGKGGRFLAMQYLAGCHGVFIWLPWRLHLVAMACSAGHRWFDLPADILTRQQPDADSDPHLPRASEQTSAGAYTGIQLQASKIIVSIKQNGTLESMRTREIRTSCSFSEMCNRPCTDGDGRTQTKRPRRLIFRPNRTYDAYKHPIRNFPLTRCPKTLWKEVGHKFLCNKLPAVAEFGLWTPR